MLESGPERIELKTALFARLDAIAPPSVILASSSSGLTMTAMQADCRHPERCVIGHPFNPPYLVPLVEVVGGKRTSEEAIVQFEELPPADVIVLGLYRDGTLPIEPRPMRPPIV